jgi:hypothetical protein
VPRSAPGQDLIESDVILGLQLIGLRAAPGERTQDYNLRARISAAGRHVLPPGQEGKLIEESLCKQATIVKIDHVLAILKV